MRFISFVILIIWMAVPGTSVFAVELQNRTIQAGSIVNISGDRITTSGNVVVQSNGGLNLKGYTIHLTPDFQAQRGSYFSASSNWDGIYPTPTNQEEFISLPVSDARMEATCHNFADNGAFYHFKITNGKVFYSRNGEFRGEFSLNSNRSSAVFKDFTSSRNGDLVPLPSLTMIAADNNRIIAKDNSDGLYWASISLEYDKDYKDYTAGNSAPWYSVPGYYSKVDPDEGNPSLGNPTFTGDPNTHFASAGYVDTTQFKLPDVYLPATGDTLKLSKVTLSSKRPILSNVTTANYEATSLLPETGPILGDLMQVVVDSCRWYKIDATPPRNFTDATHEELISSGPKSYSERKKIIFHEMSGYMVKVGKSLLKSPDPVTGVTDGEKVLQIFRASINDLKDSLIGNGPSAKEGLAVSGACIIFPFLCPGILATEVWVNQIREDASDIVDGINDDAVVAILDYVEEFYNTNMDTALAKGYDKVTFDNSLTRLQTQIYDKIVGSTKVEEHLENALRSLVSVFSLQIALGLGDLNISSFLPSATSYLPPGTHGAWEVVANNLHSWNAYFTFPADKFEMKNIYPYKNSGECKTVIAIDSIIDIGVGNVSRYEHMRMHNGGEIGSFYGKVDKPEAWDPEFAHGKIESPLESVDGHGFIDGTCNFFMLAKVRMKDTPNDNFHSAYAVLWLDEQEYFAERWHVLHPRDNAFEGLPGTFSSAFPVLSWFNGFDMDQLGQRYWTPYRILDGNSRMANSRYATVIAGKDRIYSTSFFWAITDQTWRWRYYPNVDSANGESIDHQSIGIREDQTIYLRAKKRIGNDIIDGYWYQRCLGPDNKRMGDPDVGSDNLPAMPEDRYMHVWNFMSTTAFKTANNYFRMGMYGTETEQSSNADRHYGYTGYDPHTHIYHVTDPSKLKTVTTTIGGGLPKIGISGSWELQIDSLWVNKGAVNKTRIPLTHPMYKQMSDKYKTPMNVRGYVKGPDSYFYFDNNRNDDCKLPNKPTITLADTVSTFDTIETGNGQWSPAKTTHSTQIDSVVTDSTTIIKNTDKTIRSFSVDLKGAEYIERPDGFKVVLNKQATTSKISTIKKHYQFIYFSNASGMQKISSKFLVDKNVWADIPVNGIVITHDTIANTLSCRFDLPDTINGYLPTAIKIGYIKNSCGTIFKTIPLDKGVSGKGITSVPVGIAPEQWKEYFSDIGRVQYGTSAWIEDAFGNGNVFSIDSVTE